MDNDSSQKPDHSTPEMEPSIEAGAVPAEEGAPFRLFRLPATFASLRHRNFRLFFFGQLISLTGSWMQIAALGWLIYDLTESKKALGVIGAMRMVPMMMLSILGGVIADRYSKRGILLFTQSVFMALALLLGMLAVKNMVEVWHIKVLAVMAGCAMGFDMPARHSFVVETVAQPDRGNAIALNSCIFNAARILGPAIGGILMEWLGTGAVFLINGVSYLAVIIGLMMMRLSPVTRRNADGVSALGQAREGFSIVIKQPAIRGLLILVVVVSVFGMSFTVILPAFAKDILGTGQKGYGLLLGAYGSGALVGALVVARIIRTWRKSYIILGGVILFSTMLLLFASVHTVWPAMAKLLGHGVGALGGCGALFAGLGVVFLGDLRFCFAAVCLAGVGMGFMFFLSTSNAVVQQSVSDEVRGRVMGVWAFAFVGAMPLGSLQIGFAAEYLGAATAIIIGAAVCAACATYALYVLVKRNSRTRFRPHVVV